jgi:hypothetical protein
MVPALRLLLLLQRAFASTQATCAWSTSQPPLLLLVVI